MTDFSSAMNPMFSVLLVALPAMGAASESRHFRAHHLYVFIRFTGCDLPEGVLD